VRIRSVESTDLFAGTVHQPRQVIRVRLEDVPYARVTVRVDGPGVTTPEPVLLSAGGQEELLADVGVLIAAPAPEGSVHRATVTAEAATGAGGPLEAVRGDRPRAQRVTVDTTVTAASTGWTMWMVSHFHYDPVWWNTQGGFTEAYYDIPAAEAKRPKTTVASAFDLVRAHLDAARLDPDYKFVLAEVDYLKPHWDSCPEDRDTLRRFLAEGRVEIVGGTYNEPNTNLTHPETAVRSLIYGTGFQRGVLGADVRTAWQLDVFGHDPSFPGLCADAGLDSSAWARGPFHMWGPKRHVGSNERMQFPSEFEWISPNGSGLLTSYMASHYIAGWAMDEQATTLEEAVMTACQQFDDLKGVAATPNVLLPVGGDHLVPSRWVTEVHREWARRYAWPRFTTAVPREFFDAVRAHSPGPGAGKRPGRPQATGFSPQTRDMNPVYTGKDVSYIDTKQAQRAAETAVLDAERLSTLAWLTRPGGFRYPERQLNKAWRLLAYGAHHDAITGAESDQVYADLLGGWREAFALGDDARAAAADGLAALADTRGDGTAVLVVNTLSADRGGLVTVTCRPGPGTDRISVISPNGSVVPAALEARRDRPDGTIAEAVLTFRAADVPALGFGVYRVVPAGRDDDDAAGGWEPAGGLTAGNETFEVEADPERGGALTRITDRRTGREVLRHGGAGNVLTVQEEYAEHPAWGEGPWHLLPKGPGAEPERADVRRYVSPAGERLVSVTELGGLRVTREVTLWAGEDLLDCATHVDGSIGTDRLLRVRFDADVPGARPVAESGFAVIGRSFGYPESDTAKDLWTLEAPAHTWAGLSAPAVITLPGGQRHAIGVAEVITDAPERARGLVTALVRRGVTSTVTRPDGERYGSLDADSNLPDVRIVIGGGARRFIPAERPPARRWVPGADVRGPRDLPVLEVPADEVDGVIAELAATGTIDGRGGSTVEDADDYSVALLNRGIPSFVATAGGSMYLSLMRACGGWPSGVWMDGDPVTAPDGSSLAWQHWSRTFRYSLAAGPGDWRARDFTGAGHRFNHDLLAREAGPHAGTLGPEASLARVEPATVMLSALKPAGNSGEEIALRVRETSGSPVTARIGLPGTVTEIRSAGILEDGRDPLDSPGPGITLALGACEVATLTARAGVRAREADCGLEPVQPVFSRYWLHNKGPAPAGSPPAAVHLSPSRVRPGETVRLTVAAGPAGASGTVALDVPDGLKAGAGNLSYDLGPDEYAEWTFPVHADDERPRFLAARITEDSGQVLEDAVTVGSPAAGLLRAWTGPEEIRLPPGGSGELRLTIASGAASQARGEAQLISPFGTWGPDGVRAEPWTAGFAVGPGQTARTAFTVTAPLTARPGAHWWALVKVAWFGRVQYTRAVPIVIRS